MTARTLPELRRSAAALMLAGAAWAAGCATPKPMIEPAFAARSYTPLRIALLPPDVYIIVDQIGDNDPAASAALGAQVSQETVRFLTQALHERGYDVDLSTRWDGIFDGSGTALVSREELGWMANSVLQFANSNAGGAEGPIKTPHFIAPELAAKIGWATQSDSLLYLNIKGITQTNGKRAAQVAGVVFVVVIIAAIILAMVASHGKDSGGSGGSRGARPFQTAGPAGGTSAAARGVTRATPAGGSSMAAVSAAGRSSPVAGAAGRSGAAVGAAGAAGRSTPAAGAAVGRSSPAAGGVGHAGVPAGPVAAARPSPPVGPAGAAAGRAAAPAAPGAVAAGGGGAAVRAPSPTPPSGGLAPTPPSGGLRPTPPSGLAPTPPFGGLAPTPPSSGLAATPPSGVPPAGRGQMIPPRGPGYGSPHYYGGPNVSIGIGFWVPLEEPVYTHDGGLRDDDAAYYDGDEMYLSMTLVSAQDGRVLWHVRDNFDFDADSPRDVQALVSRLVATIPARGGFEPAKK